MSSVMHHRARKRFGQNFLRDAGVIGRIVHAIDPRPGERLVEIGPGQGALTEPLLDAADSLEVIELDRDLIPGLRVQFFNYPDLVIHEGDALKYDFAQLRGEGAPLRVVGNLPYNISTPLIIHLLDAGSAVADMHFMLQKEVVERMAATPGGPDWGRLSVMAQYYCQVEQLFTVPPEAFVPSPAVESAIVRLTPHAALPHVADDPALLFELVKLAFGQRRKTLRNNLKGRVSTETLEAFDIDPTRRPQTLSVEEFVRLANGVATNEASTPQGDDSQ
ncbi:MAG: 16S rRNA (adenine(1518)-N(6)/adenine(1519)-N(6))-dimethyltransferase RsmA [Halomonas subglaciescola]|nr:16S rRNA (adenine(1518)-N(6)/adenine(1519)-N(6))-dimethyltransferase RsmA [Halomonas subglaciescola]